MRRQEEKLTGRFDLIMDKLLVFSHLLLAHRSFLDGCIRVGRRPGFLFYIWLRHDRRSKRGPEGELRGWGGLQVYTWHLTFASVNFHATLQQHVRELTDLA